MTDDRKHSNEIFNSQFLSSLNQPVYRSTQTDHTASSDSSFRSVGKDAKEDFATRNVNLLEELTEPKSCQPNLDLASSVFGDEKPPSVPGCYLEPSYHFFTNTKPVLVLNALLPALEKNRVDCKHLKNKFKIKCVSYAAGERVLFYASVFSSPANLTSSGNFVVEFQRRMGCVLHFSHLYHLVKEEMSRKSYVAFDPCSTDSSSQSVSSCSSSSVTSSSVSSEESIRDHKLQQLFESELKAGISPEQAQSTVSNLFAMMRSPYVDVMLHALEALSELTREELMANAVFALKGEAYLLPAVKVPSEDVRRCAITTLANLVDGVASGKNKNKVTLCQTLLEEKEFLSTLISLRASTETQRITQDIARLVTNLASTVSKEVLASNSLWSSLLESETAAFGVADKLELNASPTVVYAASATKDLYLASLSSLLSAEVSMPSLSRQ